MRLMPSLLLFAAAATAALGFASGPAAARTEWQMPTPYPPGNFHTVTISQFAEDIRQATGGQLDIVVHPAGSLLPLPQIRRAVAAGDVQIGEVFLPALENEDPVFGADAVPFIVTGYDAAARLMEAQRPLLDRRLAGQGIRLLYMVAWPPQGLYAPRPIARAEDLRGLNFRSYGPAAARFGELIGATVSTIQAADLAQSLATGRVNSMITSPVTGVDSRVWETPVKHFYDIQAWVPKNAVIVNEAAFQALAPATREIVLAAARAAEQRGWEASRAAAERALETLRQNGVAVEPPSPELARGLHDIGLRLVAEWEERAGPDGVALFAPFRQ